MSRKPLGSAEVFWLSCMAGAYGGVAVQGLFGGGAIPAAELWAVPVFVLGYGTIAIPVVAVGLLLFGLPVTALLRRHAERWWVGVVAVLWGGVSGRLLFYAIDQALFLGKYRLGEIQALDLGLLHGVPTAVTWWRLKRRQLRRQTAAAQAPARP